MTAQPYNRSPAAKSTKKRKSVSFHKAMVGGSTGSQDASCMFQIHWIPPNTDEDIRARWYNKTEYKEIKTAVKKVVRTTFYSAVKNIPVDEDHEDYCTRGLELVTPIGIQQQKERRQKILAAVWNAQVRQWNQMDKIYDPEAIALASRKETKNSACFARGLGVRDELSVEKHNATMLAVADKDGSEYETRIPLDEPLFNGVVRAIAA